MTIDQQTETIPLSITQEQYDRIKAAEAVVVGKYSGSGGAFSKLAFIGSEQECEEFIETPSLFLIPQGLEYLGHEVVLREDLIPPEGVTCQS
jgi:hypothetical protein